MKSESINELATALAKAQQEIKAAHKDAANPFFKSKYADLASTWDACRDALNKNGLSVAQTISNTIDGHATLITTLMHSSGQWIDGGCPLILNERISKDGEPIKPGMQELGSAVSYARRYGLAAICGVVAEDDDANTSYVKQETKTETRSDATSPCTASLGSYTIKIPKNKNLGRTLEQLGYTTVNNDFQYWSGRTKDEPAKGFVKEFLDNAGPWLEKERSKFNPEKIKTNPKDIPDREEEIPFDPDMQWRGR